MVESSRSGQCQNKRDHSVHVRPTSQASEKSEGTEKSIDPLRHTRLGYFVFCGMLKLKISKNHCAL